MSESSAKSTKSAESAESAKSATGAVLPALLALLALPMALLALPMALLALPMALLALPTPRPNTVHDTHVSHTRLVLEDRAIALRVRLFHDDLTLALKAYSHQTNLTITRESRADSLFGGYYAGHVKLTVNGTPVALRVTASGMEEDDAAQQIVWYVLEGTLDTPATTMVLLNGLLFDAFKDQQNIVQLLRLPGDTRRTLYFSAVDPRDQTVEF